ncbi:MAG: VirB4 family type IV secretion system protein [bacterium]
MFIKTGQSKGIGIELTADAPFDVFDSPDNFNGVMVGQSGSGKSFLIGQLTVSYLSKGYDVVTFDSGYSHEKLAKMSGGKHIEFSLDSPVSVNPFALCREDEDIDDLRGFIYGIIERCYAVLPEKTEEEYKKERYILCSIDNALHTLRDTNRLSMHNLIDILIYSNDPVIVDAGLKLKDFNDKYGEFFSSVPEVNFDGHYTVIETSKLDDIPILRDVVISSLLMLLSKKIRGKGETRTVCFMDEYDKYCNSALAWRYIEDDYRRFRSLNASIITSIQDFNDIYNSNTDSLTRHGRVLLNNSSWRIFLKQTESSINALKLSQLISFSDMDYQALRSVSNHKPHYSEVVVYSPFKENKSDNYFNSDIMTIKPANKFMYHVLSSSASDNAEIKKHLPDGLDIKNATAMDIASAIFKIINK